MAYGEKKGRSGSAAPGDTLLEVVSAIVGAGYCIGCGVCAALPGSPIQIRLDRHGQYQAMVPPHCDAGTVSVDNFVRTCPFSGVGPNEDELATELFGTGLEWDPRIGSYRELYAGYVLEGSYRANGSSGGFGTWIVAELFRRGEVDAVIHVRPSDRSKRGMLFEYMVSESLDDIQLGASSRYYPIELSEVLQIVREREARYAIVGLPCFVKAVRRLGLLDDTIRRRITYYVGLVCGHLKSTFFAESHGWQLGIGPDSLIGINFRKKLSRGPASQYGVEVVGYRKGKIVRITRRRQMFLGSDWGMGFFKYNACDYCDDVVAETADVTVGDAWLPGYVNDSRGTNIVIVRDERISQLLKEALGERRIVLEPINADAVVQSQAAGLRHRKKGLAYRLYKVQSAGRWVPKKRVESDGQHLTERERLVQDLRLELAAASKDAFANAKAVGDYRRFVRCMRPLVKRYEATAFHPIRRVALRVRAMLARFA